MSCEHLICAQCAGPVAEGRCPTCRESRAHVHHETHGLSIQLIMVTLLVLAVLALAATRLAH
jgi:ferredoxin